MALCELSMPRQVSPSTLFKRAEKLAREKFGFSELSPGQRDALCSILAPRDTLAILPTGGGKSAIYALAGLVRGGLTLVVSPLVALQKDQVEHLRALGIEAHLLNSSLSPLERGEVWDAVTNAKTAFLLLAPEQFSNHETLERLQQLKPSLFVVDEAHCVSRWGHDFRPDFARLGLVIESLGNPPTLALTATAAPPVRSEILERLHLRDAQIVVAGFDRPNLRLEVRHFTRCDDKREALFQTTIEGPQPAIIYCATRRETEDVAQQLERRGLQALAYHAGLSGAQRDERQSAFMNGEADVFVATVAFGMGVDKPGVRRVLHLDVSDSLDSYFQEAGRAGRDGENASAILFFCEEDLGLRRFQLGSGESFLSTATHLAAALDDMKATSLDEVERELDLSHASLHRALGQLEEAGALSLGANGEITLREHLDLRVLKRHLKDGAKHARDWDTSRLEMMRQYAQTTSCRRQLLLGYFGEHLPQRCNNCDNCQNGTPFDAPAQNTQNSLQVGAFVRHKNWGDGQLLHEDGDSLTVLFEKVGYKTLARALVSEKGLLEIKTP